MQKLNTISLSKMSIGHVFGNFKEFLNRIKYVFPSFLAVLLAEILAVIYEIAWVEYLVLIVYFLLIGIFMRSWYRFALLGHSDDRLANPFQKKSYDFGFFLTIFLFAVLFMAGIYAAVGIFFSVNMGMLMDVETVLENEAFLFGASVIVALLFVCLFLKLSFVMPAKAIGKNLGCGEAWRLSTGAIGPLLGSSFIISLFSFLLSIVLVFNIIFETFIAYNTEIPDFDMGEIAPVAETPITNMAIIKTFLMMAAESFITFIVIAMYVSAISFAYQWQENNKLAKA